MTAAELRAALARLGLSQVEAARVLGAPNRQRVNAWCRGRRPVPPTIAAHVRTLLAMQEEWRQDRQHGMTRLSWAEALDLATGQ